MNTTGKRWYAPEAQGGGKTGGYADANRYATRKRWYTPEAGGGMLLYLLAALKFLLPFFLQSSIYEPHRDEFLYLQEAHHMAWGYMEAPPLLSVCAWLGQHLGHSQFWIKCWPSLFGALTFLVTGRIILALGGRTFALLLGWLPFVIGAYLRVHFLFQPNAPENLFWTLMAYTMIRAVQSGEHKWLYWWGVSVGLGMLTKYSVAFYFVGIVGGLLLTRQRRLQAEKHFYFALGIALLIFLPNLTWEATHHFPIIFHMRELQKHQLKYVSPANFLISQILLNLPNVCIWVTGLWVTAFSVKYKEYRFVAWAWVIVILLLLAGHGKDYYALGAYPALFAFGACRLEELTRRRGAKETPDKNAKPRSGLVSIGLRGLIVLPSLVLCYWLTPVALPMVPPAGLSAFYGRWHLEKLGILTWEDGKTYPLPQDFSDMLGWKEIAEKTARAYASLDANEKKSCLVFADNYGEAGALNYYGGALGLPGAYSDNASFLYWLPDSLLIDNLVLVTDDKQEMEHPFLKNFASVKLVDSITTPYARERGSLIIVLKHANLQMQADFRDKIEKDKKKILP